MTKYLTAREKAQEPLGFRRMFRYAPSNSAAHTRWFKYGFVKGLW